MNNLNLQEQNENQRYIEEAKYMKETLFLDQPISKIIEIIKASEELGKAGVDLVKTLDSEDDK